MRQQVLPPRKWNEYVEGAWRMNINVGIVQDTQEHEGICGVGSDLNDDSKGEGSGLECSESDLSDKEESESKNSSDER